MPGYSEPFDSRVRELERKLCQLFGLRVVAWGRGDRSHHRGRKLVGDLLVIHQGVVTVYAAPTLMIEDFDWQNGAK